MIWPYSGAAGGESAQLDRLCVLHRELPETADTGDCQPLSWPYLGLFNTLVCCDPGAKDGSHFGEIRVRRQAAYIRRRADHVLGEAPFTL